MIQKALKGFFKNGSENGSTKKVKGKSGGWGIEVGG
jgi:hypothetical protein